MEGIKKRTSNFNEGEEKVLIDLVNKYQHIIENKKTDAVTNGEKLNTWKEISREFNSICGGCKSYQTLKTKFKNLKKITKCKVASERNGIRGTGGGPPLPETPLTPAEKQLREIMGRTLTGFSSRFGGDAFHDQAPIIIEYNDEYNLLPEKDDEAIEEETPEVCAVSEGMDSAPSRAEDNFYATPSKVSQEYSINEMPSTSGFYHPTPSCAKKKLYRTPAIEPECRVNEMPSTSGLIQQTTPHAKENEASTSKDWSNYTPAKLREKKSRELTLPRENVRDKISTWARSKAQLVEAQKEAFKEEHEKKMEHMQAQHDMQINILQEEWALKKAQMIELHEKKLSQFK